MDSFSALADPTRRQIVEDLSRLGVLNASDIAGRFDMSKPAISQHLKTLKEAGLVTVEVRAQQRLYRLDPEALVPMETWIANTRRMWSQNLSRLETLLNLPDHDPEKENDDGD